MSERNDADIGQDMVRLMEQGRSYDLQTAPAAVDTQQTKTAAAALEIVKDVDGNEIVLGAVPH